MSDTKTELLKSHAHEQTKSYYEYDGFNRLTKVYDAYIDIAHGGPCLVTEYAFEGNTARIKKRKEYRGVWDSSFEM